MSQGPQAFDAVKNPNPAAGDDPAYIASMLHAAFAARATLPRDDAAENAAAGFPNQPDIGYWTNTAIIGHGFTWGPYWWDKIQNATFGGASDGGSGTGGAATGNPNGNLLTPQLGLLEDDLAYRLALLCVNVLQPLKDKYPNIVVVSGFRQTNTGIGQHELGEAVDIQLRNQPQEGRLATHEVADWISKNLVFDQLILNFTTVGDGSPWIHVSFSGKSNRQQVLTKDFSDNFHDGLFDVQPLTGEAAAQVLRDQAESDAKILTELQNIQIRQTRFGQTPPAVSAGANTTTGATASAGPGTFPQDFDAIKNPTPSLGRDITYVTQMINAAFIAFRATFTGQQPEASQEYWLSAFQTKNTATSGDGWGAYWWDFIQRSPGIPA